jgi:hypothetical protein
MAKIVISYRREDSKWTADLIFNRLESHYGKGNVFMDIDSIPFGLDFRDHIRETLDRCDVMVALVGPNWVGHDSAGKHILDETDWVRIEIEAALNKKIPLIPLLIDGSRMPKPDELPEALRNFVFRQSAAIDRDNFRAQMDKVIASIDQHLSKLAAKAPIEIPELKPALSAGVSQAPIVTIPESSRQQEVKSVTAEAPKSFQYPVKKSSATSDLEKKLPLGSKPDAESSQQDEADGQKVLPANKLPDAVKLLFAVALLIVLFVISLKVGQIWSSSLYPSLSH